MLQVVDENIRIVIGIRQSSIISTVMLRRFIWNKKYIINKYVEQKRTENRPLWYSLDDFRPFTAMCTQPNLLPPAS